MGNVRKFIDLAVVIFLVVYAFSVGINHTPIENSTLLFWILLTHIRIIYLND